jgi:uncharacterized membrane protein YoaK (UPF0700 family)
MRRCEMAGYKTYLVALLLALATFAKAMGWIDNKMYEIIIGILGALGLGALRAGVTKSGPQ